MDQGTSRKEQCGPKERWSGRGSEPGKERVRMRGKNTGRRGRRKGRGGAVRQILGPRK